MEKYIVSKTPYLRLSDNGPSTQKMMNDLLISLLPIIAFVIYYHVVMPIVNGTYTLFWCLSHKGRFSLSRCQPELGIKGYGGYSSSADFEQQRLLVWNRRWYIWRKDIYSCGQISKKCQFGRRWDCWSSDQKSIRLNRQFRFIDCLQRRIQDFNHGSNWL